MIFEICSPTYGSYLVRVDDEDDWVLCYTWTLRKDKTNLLYVTGTNGSVRNKKLHRLLMGVDDPEILIDHHNHDTLDNRKANLRVCSSSNNSMNRTKQLYHSGIPTTSTYKGVTFTKDRGNLICRSQIRVGRKLLQKRFPCTPEGEVLAARWYDEKAIEFFGEFALINGV